jgi:uncharacterized protein (TIGR02266 family)
VDQGGADDPNGSNHPEAGERFRDGIITLLERRGEIRVAASLRVGYQSLDELVEVYTDNISRGGLFIRTIELLPIGAVVKIKIDLADGGEAFDAIGRVTHIVGPAEAGKAPVGMGVEFLDVGGAPLADRIARYLAAQGAEQLLPPSPAGVSALVLVIDDDPAYRDRVARVVEEAGHRATTAKNGLDGLRKALERRPDLILTDIEMPALDGWQFVRLVHARPTLADVPVVFFTSNLDDDGRLRGYQLGVSDFIEKPFLDEEMALQVQRTLERAHAYPRRVAQRGMLRGELSQVALGRVLALLAAEKREGILLLVGRDEVAAIGLRDGAPVRVDLPDKHENKQGVDRLHYLLDWNTGRFEFSAAEVRDDNTINLPTAAVLLQHAQRFGEEPTTP